MTVCNARTVGLWQGPSPAGDRDLACAIINRAAQAAGAAGADVVVFPELFLSGYDRDDLPDLALTCDAATALIAPLARAAGCAICTGYPERTPSGLANAALCVGADGSLLANHRKIQLYGATESDRFIAGDSYTLFDLNGTRAAIMICYDVEFAPHIAALKARGVDLILAPTAAMHPFIHVGDHVVPAMAANHAVTIVYANFCGQENATRYFGRSSITGADGRTRAQAGDGPCLLISEIPTSYDSASLSTQAGDYKVVDG